MSEAVAVKRRRGFPPPVLRHRNFALFFYSLLASNTGTWMAQTARSWLVYEITGSPALLGAVFGVFGIPMIVLPYFGGTIADRFDRKKILWVTQSSTAALAILFGVLVATGVVEVWHILVISFLQAVSLAFDQPTRQALLPDLVPRDELRPAIALNSTVFTGGAFLGPAVAGLLVAQLGVPLATVFFINAASFGSVMIALAFIKLQAFKPSKDALSVAQSLREGISFVRRTELILLVLVLTLVTSFFGRSYQSLAPVFAKDILDVGIQGFGFMMSAPGAGSIMGAVLIGMDFKLPRNGILSLAAAAAFAIILVVFAASRLFGISLAMLFLLGILNTTAMASARTMVQLATPRRLMGRVMSMNTIAAIGFGPMGGFVVGPIAEVIGAPTALYIAALVVLAAVSMLAFVRPTLRTAE